MQRWWQQQTKGRQVLIGLGVIFLAGLVGMVGAWPIAVLLVFGSLGWLLWVVTRPGKVKHYPNAPGPQTWNERQAAEAQKRLQDPHQNEK